jgi:hypothetical protein
MSSLGALSATSVSSIGISTRGFRQVPQDELPKGAADPAAAKESLSTSSGEPSSTNDEVGTAAADALTAEEEQLVEALKKRDAEVRRHEAAHVAAGGPYVRGAPSYTFQTGPDGRRYAIGGEVQIDTSPVPGDPEATIQKALAIRRSALSPAEPSSADRAVAAAAAQLEAEARIELARAQFENLDPSTSSQDAAEPTAESEATSTVAYGATQSPQAEQTLGAYLRNATFGRSRSTQIDSVV